MIVGGTVGTDRMAARADAFAVLFGGAKQPDDWTGTITNFEHGVDQLWMSLMCNLTHDANVAFDQFCSLG